MLFIPTLEYCKQKIALLLSEAVDSEELPLIFFLYFEF